LLSLILMGLIQGLTEFLPISSSGHLVLAKYFFNLDLSGASFEALLHFATIMAVIILFKKEILKLINSFFNSLKQLSQGEKLSIIFKKNEYSKFSWFLIISTIPAALIGYVFKQYIESLFNNVIIVPSMLAITGIMLKLSNKNYKSGHKNISSLTIKDALVIGLAQAIAIVPGISRSGITVIAGMKRGLDIEFAAKYSFILSIPIILGATLFEFNNLSNLNLNNNYLLFSAIVAFLSSYWAMKWFIKLLLKQKVVILSYYLWSISLVTYFFIFFKGE